MLILFSEILSPLKTAFSLLLRYWWVYMPILLFLAALESWLTYIRQKYFLSIKWVLLEVKPPPDVEKSPKIAENIFSGLHGVYAKPISWKKRFFEGKVQDWFSFEIVGNGGEINFYIRTPEDLRNLVEAQVFAQYPDAEIKIADDYVDSLPYYLPTEKYDLFGAELIFTKEDAYPIKTYPFFEEESGKGEFKRTDPLAPLAEIMSTLEPGEHLWLQLLIRPTGDDWVKEAKPVLDKLVGKEPEGGRDIPRAIIDFPRAIIDFIDWLLPGGAAAGERKEREEKGELFEYYGKKAEEKRKQEEEKKKKKEEFSTMRLTPGQKFVLEQVENKIAKLGFKAGYRFLYIARKEIFHRAHVSAVIGMFKQLYSNNLNTFKPNSKVGTSADGWFPWLFPSDRGFFADQQEYKRKRHIYQAYKKRTFVKQVVVLNTEELATLFHLPGIGVKAPAFPRVEAKKGQPPAGLPTG